MLRRDSSCRRDLLWKLDHDLSGQALVDRCHALGFDGVSHWGRLWIFSTPERDQVVIVVASGRVQLRMDPIRAVAQRAAAAEVLAERLLGGRGHG